MPNASQTAQQTRNFTLCAQIQVFAWVFLSLSGGNCQAQWADSFEGGETRWRIVESDCQAQLTEHSISLVLPHGGRTCEMFEMSCGHGTLALLAYPIEPCSILDEFRPRLWTRCSSGRIQLGVRVIFPQARHPVTSGQLTALLWGDIYTDTGQWQMLEVGNLLERFRKEIVSLRQLNGPDAKLDGAYIDCLVLNAYTGPGRYRVQVDDLDLRGLIPMAAIGQPPPQNWRALWRWRHEAPDPEQKFWATANKPALWLQYQGEQLPWIASLGFTGVVTNRLPSEPWLKELRNSNLGVICPPPAVPVQFSKEVLPTLRGWLIGAALDSHQTSAAREQSSRVAAMPADHRRPLIAEALEDFFLFSRVADELIVPTPIASSAGPVTEKQSWLASKLALTQQRGEGWASISVGITPTLVEQIETAAKILEPTVAPDSPADPLGLRQQTTGAVIAGAKGLLLRTFKRLDLQTAGGNAQVAALKWISNDLKLWGPWIVAGQTVAPPVISDSNWRAAAWSISQSHLVVAQTAAPASQYCLPATHETPIDFGFAASNVGQQVFRLSSGFLDRIDTIPTPAGLRWTIAKPVPVESFLITSSPLVIKFAREQLAQSATQNAADQLEITTYNLSLAARVVEARFPQGAENLSQVLSIPQVQQINAAQRALDQGWQALRSQRPSDATRLMYLASDIVQSVLADTQRIATSNLAAPQSSPFVVTPAALHYHWLLAQACDRGQWQDLALPGGELTNLNTMLESGWSQQRRLEERVDLRVELVQASEERASGLRLAAYAKTMEDAQEMTGGYEGASLRVRSASAAVKAGQLIRVSASARILRACDQPGSGLLIYDNQVGPSLGQLVNGAAGQVVPIELYRFAIADGEFRLLAECRGECDIVLDSLRASVITPATNRRAYDTAPLDAIPFGASIVP